MSGKLPNSPISLLTEENVKSLSEVSTTTLCAGVFNLDLLKEFIEKIESTNLEEKDVVITVIRRDDDFVKSGSIIAEIQTEPKTIIGIAGREYTK